MYKAYKFRLYPNDVQKKLINKTFGCYRFVYNYFLDKCKNNGFVKVYDMIRELPSLYADYPFLKEVDSCSLRCALFNLEDAFKNFFEKRCCYPKFKNRFNRQSYRTNANRSSYKGNDYCNIEINLTKNIIKLPKLGFVEIRGYRNYKSISGRVINATITRECSGKYYVSVVVEECATIKDKCTPNSIVGIDLGVKDLVITSNGEKYSNPKVLMKFEKRLKRLQRKLSRQIRGSSNYNKTKIKIARVYEKIKNTRKHNIINIVNKIVKENDIIVSEKLNIKSMSQNHKLAKNVLDSCLNKICNMLSWKCEIEGKHYLQVDTYFPSSKICSHCGTKTEITNDLSVRKWECMECGSMNDRDVNASINIMFEGLKLYYQK